MGLKSLKISLMRYAVIIIPIACVLSRIIGPTGVWHAFWLAELITASVCWGELEADDYCVFIGRFLVSKKAAYLCEAKNVTVHICPVTWKVRKDCRCLTLLGICVK